MDGLCWLRRQNAQTEQPRNAGPFSCDTKTGSAYSSGAHCSFVGGLSFSEDCQLFPEEGATSAPHSCTHGIKTAQLAPGPQSQPRKRLRLILWRPPIFFSEACVLLRENKSASELARAEPLHVKPHLRHSTSNSENRRYRLSRLGPPTL